MATQNQASVVSQVKGILAHESVKARFNDVLGPKAPQFMASILNSVSGNNQLKKCDANSILSAAFVAASYDLPIDSNLGFSALVPYNNRDVGYQAQFQMMYKGFIQLAIRSGYYKRMNCSVVYKDELKSYNPIYGEMEFVSDFSICNMRDEGNPENIIGYFAWFELSTGFRKELFMTTAEITNHAKKYSKAYQYDISKNKKSSKWTTDFESMGLKTVIKLLLSKWGILSVDMQRAIQDDQKIYENDGSEGYADNPQKKEIPGEAIDAFAQAIPVVKEESDFEPAESDQEKEFLQFEQQIRNSDYDIPDEDGLPFK